MITDRVLRRGAVLRELASLGCSAAKAEEITDASYGLIWTTARRCGVVMPKGSNVPIRINHISDRILRDYGKMRTCDMAERYGSTKKSVYATVSKLRKAGKLPMRESK